MSPTAGDERVTIIGGGIMGAGIAFVSRVGGLPVTLVEPEESLLEAARARVDRSIEQAEKRGTDLANLGPLVLTTDLEGAVGDATIVVEAIPEDLDLKQGLFARLGSAAGNDTILASNTSGLPIAALADASGRAEQVVGLHFFNPVPAMKLVEVVRTPDTTSATVERALAFCHQVGKETVEVRDAPGFVTTRLIMLLIAEAIRIHEQGIASAEHLDRAMVLAFNHPVGPLALADRIGLDTGLAILEDLEVAFGAAFAPPAALRELVAAGRLGRKTGAGFYDYA